jgi:predicted nucleic acid-binding protein
VLAVLDPNVLARPRFRRWISTPTAAEFIAGLQESAVIIDDPPEPAALTPDPDDDYLIGLAQAGGADYLVSGDRHLTELPDPDPPVLTPRQFLALLDER